MKKKKNLTVSNDAKVFKCFCLSNSGNLHCPLTTERSDLEQTFNFQFRGEQIVSVEIDFAFVCHDERTPSCQHCPFN